MTLRRVFPSIFLVVFLASCVRPAPTTAPWRASTGGGSLPVGALPLPTGTPAQPAPQPAGPASAAPVPTIFVPPTPAEEANNSAPTPDPPREMPTPRAETEQYVTQAGDSLGKIAQKYGISLQSLLAANPTTNPDLLYVGITLTIPPQSSGDLGPAFKIIPDSELVYGPNSADFDLAGFVKSYHGLLANYREKVDDVETSGADIVDRVAHEYSVNPRLLLAVLEYQANWLTQSNPEATPRGFPLGKQDSWRTGLYRQLAWAADNLNRGYYLWRSNGVSTWILADGTAVPVSGTINAGTAGVQAYFAQLMDVHTWQQAVSAEGLYKTYASMFGSPFALAFEPVLPEGLQQPSLQLPFEPGDSWSFTGGPHGGWGDGSAWAGLDFAPPGEALGCVENDAWDAAVADGLILRAEDGEVIQDLDGDGLEQTGWVVLYMHVESRDRVQPGTHVKAGDPIGHPSCEGGVSSGTHLHLARRYNGEWISTDGQVPFNLDGWISQGYGTEYDGVLKHNHESVEAWVGRKPENQIKR